MTQKHDAPEGGAELKQFTLERLAGRPMLRFGALDGFVFEDAVNEDILANLKVWLNRMLESDRGLVDRLAPTPPAPSGLVDAVPPRVSTFERWHIEKLVREWMMGPGFVPAVKSHLIDGLVHSLRIRLDRADNTTLSGQQGGAVPAGERRAPVQRFSAGIPWSMHLRAWDVYSKQYGRQQSAQRMAERGGFGARELDMFIPGWREELSELARLKAENDRLRTLLSNSKADR